MALADFFGSWLFWLIVIIALIWIGLKIVSSELLGMPIGQFLMQNRRVDFDDIDATAHMRLYKEQARAARFSMSSRARWLYMQSVDPNFYSTEWGGRKLVGKVKGVATYPSCHVILFRKPWRYRKFIFIAPPKMCLSGTGSRNLIYEGTSLEILNADWVFPVPSMASGYTEQWMREWAIDIYKTRMKQMSDVNLVDFGEYLLLKAGSDTVEARMAQQQIAEYMTRTESAEAEGDTGEMV